MADPIILGDDLLLVNRDGVNYQVTREDARPPICNRPELGTTASPVVLEDDLFLVNRGNVDYKATKAELIPSVCDLEELPEDLPPKLTHGVFHIINASGRVTLNSSSGPYEAFDTDGNPLGTRTYIDPGEEIVIHTASTSCHRMFYGWPDNAPVTWSFGDQTDTSAVTDMSEMFYFCYNFTGDVSSWDTGNVTDMSEMFTDNIKFNSDISGWNTSKVTDMDEMFRNCMSFDQDLSQWCVSKIPSKPFEFDLDSGIDGTAKEPQWGTCPRGEDTP